jgi:hypothetical protein
MMSESLAGFGKLGLGCPGEKNGFLTAGPARLLLGQLAYLGRVSY